MIPTTSLAAAGMAVLAAAMVAVAPATGVTALATGEPADGTVILGAWLYMSDDPSLPDVGGDRPSKFNSRLGYNGGSFQLEQSIPLALNPYSTAHEEMPANFSFIDDGTDASIFLTVYANQQRDHGSGLALVTDDELTKLAQQVSNVSASTGKQMYIRFCPEMNGSWMLYGVQADAFKATWIRMANIMRSLAPNVALVWSPNFDLGNGATYDPYYPGDDYVDWVGLSAYWKGSKNAATQDVNTQAPSDYFTQIVDGTGTEGGMVNFYTNYASGKGKPFVLSEGGAAFITCEEASGSSNCVATAVGDGQSTIEMSFWNSVLSDSFLSAHPLFKMFQIFEHKKFEEYNGGTGSVFRDYRVSVDGTTRDAFAARVATLASAGKLVLGKAFTASSSSSASVTKSATSASVSTASTSSSSKTTGAAASVRPGFTSSAAAAAFVLASLGAVLFTF